MDSYDIMLYVSYALVGIGTVVSVLLPLIKSLDDPKSLMKSGLGVVIILALFFVCYSISSNEVLPKFEGEPFNLTPGMSQMVGGLMFTTYVLTVVAIAGIVITELNKALK
jgi:NADH:ubiquinone oxidoreductase subunit 6 (subunit J)